GVTLRRGRIRRGDPADIPLRLLESAIAKRKRRLLSARVFEADDCGRIRGGATTETNESASGNVAVSRRATGMKVLQSRYGWEAQKGLWLGRNGLTMALCIVVGLGVGLRAYALDFQSLWTDEISSLMIPDPMLPFHQFWD